ncbi:FtsX-like permease family protein [bacterium]|nr:FtsX-like permease family protein [bacterium]
MQFILKMARRDLRSAWRRLLFFFICIAIGVGAIVALRSIIRNFNHVMTSDARAILGADIRISSNRPWTPNILAVIDRIAKPFVKERAESVESDTMMRPAEESNQRALLVELEGIEPPYPFYGQFTLAHGQIFQHELIANNGVLVGNSVLERLHLKTGDKVKIGTEVFTIRGILEREPGASGGFRFGPKALISKSAFERAQLTGFGSRSRRRISLRVEEENVEKVSEQLRTELKTSFVSVRTYRQSQERMDEQFTRAENFLSLTGFIILILGGIGVSSVTRVFIEEKRKSIAVLKCLGGTGRKIFSVYLLQISLLGLTGSLVGIVLAKITLYLLGAHYESVLPPNMSYSLQWHAVIQGMGFGLLVTMLFSVLPLLRIRHIKPNVLLREETESTLPGPRTKRRIDVLRWSVATAVLGGLLLLSVWQAGSLRVGIFFLSGLVVTALVLHFTARLLMRLVRRFKRIASFETRHAISSLYRPGNQTHVIVMAVGLGSFFIIATQAMQSNLLREMDFQKRTNLPNMYLIDIQSDQKEGVEKIIRNATNQKPLLLPTVRARISAINGKNIDPESEAYKKDRGRLGFEYTLTYRGKLDETESILSGKFWENTASPKPEVSIEESLKGMMGLDVGGNITFDILGRKINAKVTSIRRVDWKNARTGFYVLFRPGVLEAAPNVYVAALDAPLTEPARSQFQSKLVDAYPNVTAIDVVDIVRGIQKILNTITLGISFIGSFVFLSGVLILIGSIAMTKFQRIYEAAILKTLGATRKIVLSILMLEYALLGLVSGLIGSVAAIGLSYAITEHVFEIDWELTPLVYLLGVLVTSALVTLVGALSSLGVLNRKPLGILRTQ